MTEPYDEKSIGGDDRIIRRIDPVQHIVPDSNRGGSRISSKAFQPSSGPAGGMSVDLEALMLEADVIPRDFVTTPRFRGSVSFTARVARDLGLRVGYDPITGGAGVEPNPYHGEVWGSSARPNSFSNGQKKGLQRASGWYVQLPDVSIM